SSYSLRSVSNLWYDPETLRSVAVITSSLPRSCHMRFTRAVTAGAATLATAAALAAPGAASAHSTPPIQPNVLTPSMGAPAGAGGRGGRVQRRPLTAGPQRPRERAPASGQRLQAVLQRPLGADVPPGSRSGRPGPRRPAVEDADEGRHAAAGPQHQPRRRVPA